MTRALTLRNCFHGNSTIVENDFIDHHMAKANGEYVKIYLLLLRYLNANDSAPSISGMADRLDCTERDILRAFHHWENEGLLHLAYDESGNISGVTVGASDASSSDNLPGLPGGTPRGSGPCDLTQDSNPSELTQDSKSSLPRILRQDSDSSLSQILPQDADSASCVSREELRQLYFVIEQYIGKPLSPANIQKINYFFDTLKFPADLIEYLVEHCVEAGHRSFRYIESVALAWSDAGIKDVAGAKRHTALHNKVCFSVMNAFGISGRNLATVELNYIKKWTDKYKASPELILEACNRTIEKTHTPDFKYADSILSSWAKENVRHLGDVSRLDTDHQKKTKAAKSVPASAPAASVSARAVAAAANRFNNFEGRSYDIDSLERQLLEIGLHGN